MTENSFDVLGLSILRGRAFTRADGPASRRVAVVDETFASLHWPGESPVGKQIYAHPSLELLTVVGLTNSARHNGRLAPENRGYIYVPYAQLPRSFISGVARTANGEGAGRITELIHRIDPDAVVYDMVMAEERLRSQEALPRLAASVTSIYGIVTYVVCVIGVYSVFSYRMLRQKRDIALRQAIGATRRDVIRDTLANGLGTASIGLAVGVALVLVLAKPLSEVAAITSPLDPIVLVPVVVVVLAAALVACGIPAFKAAAGDSMAALRDD